MKEKSISKSFRLPELDVLWLENTAKSKGVNQTDFIKECINKQKNELLNSEALMIFNEFKDKFKDVNDYKDTEKISKVLNELFKNNIDKIDLILGFTLDVKNLYVLNKKEKTIN
jgi:hypothetical protein